MLKKILDGLDDAAFVVFNPVVEFLEYLGKHPVTHCLVVSALSVVTAVVVSLLMLNAKFH